MIPEERILDEMARRRDNINFALDMASGQDDPRAILSLYKSLIELNVLYVVYRKYAQNPVITTEENEWAIREGDRICRSIEEKFLSK